MMKTVNRKPKRNSWDSTWMSICKIIATRSCDSEQKVAAIVVASDNTQILALGYNGNYSGGPNTRESTDPGQSGFLHGEINALLKLDYNNPKKKVMYVTLSPCKMCAKAIVNAGINEVVYNEVYRDESGLNILRKAGIDVRQYMD